MKDVAKNGNAMAAGPWLWLLGGFAACVAVIGLDYWRIPYARIDLPLPLMRGLNPLMPLLAALLARWQGGVRVRWAVPAMALSMPAVVGARVVVDVLADPTAHTLWPFEIALALLVGFPCAIVGAMVGSWLAFRALRRKSGG
jgi:hypothetical protein